MVAESSVTVATGCLRAVSLPLASTVTTSPVVPSTEVMYTWPLTVEVVSWVCGTAVSQS